MLVGYDVVKTGSVAESQSHLQSGSVDMAILDIMGVDGYKLLYIAKDKKDRDDKLLFQSG